MNGLKLLQRQQQANGTEGAYVFINERGQPFVASCAEWSRISVPDLCQGRTLVPWSVRPRLVSK